MQILFLIFLLVIADFSNNFLEKRNKFMFNYRSAFDFVTVAERIKN